MTAAPRPLEGRHAVVTGGAGGIGGAIALALAGHGAALTLMGRTRAALESAAARIAAAHGGTVRAVVCDVGDAASVAAAFAGARRAGGAPAILIQSAGQAAGAAVADTTPELWSRLLSVNVIGAFLCIREVLPAMREAGFGRIVNIASTAGLKGYRHTAAYTASKHALVGLTRALSLETAGSGVTVNAVCPGYTETGMAAAAIENLKRAGRSEEEARRLLLRHNPLGRFIRPEEVAGAVAWLCGPEAGAVTGEAVVVAGGEVM